MMNFGFPPSGRGGPVFNFRSEGRRFESSNRCIIPASGFFEFVGKKYPKAKYRFAAKGSPITGIAGIWRGTGNHPPCFAMLTTAPGADIAPYHNRQVVVLKSHDWSAWLHLAKPETNYYAHCQKVVRRLARARGFRLSSPRAIGGASISRRHHSWGASAVDLALKYPAAVRGLVLASGYYYPARPGIVAIGERAVPLIGDLLAYTISPLLGRGGVLSEVKRRPHSASDVRLAIPIRRKLSQPRKRVLSTRLCAWHSESWRNAPF